MVSAVARTPGSRSRSSMLVSLSADQRQRIEAGEGRALFEQARTDACNSIMLAALVIREMVRNNQSTDFIPRRLRDQLVAIAEQRLDHRILEQFGDRPGTHLLRLQRLHIDEQRAIAENRRDFEVVNETGPGKYATIRVAADNLTSGQVRQVIDNYGHVRSEAEQIQYLESRPLRMKVWDGADGQPFVLDKARKVIVFKRACVVSLDRLKELAAEAN